MPEFVAKALELKDGSCMDIMHIPGGDKEGSSAIKSFYSSWGREWRQYIFDAADGKFNDLCEDHFVLGLVDGKALGGMWFAGSPRNKLAVVTFGHVYTLTEARGRGISSVMMSHVCRYFKEHVRGKAIYLATGWTGVARKIYDKLGFSALSSNSIIMRWTTDGLDGTEFERKYFEPGHASRIRDANIGDCGNYEALFNCANIPFIVDYSGRCFRNSGFESGYLGYLCSGNYSGLKMLETTDSGAVVGASMLRTPSGKWTGHVGDLEFCINYSYWDKAAELLDSSLASVSPDIKIIRSFSAGNDDPKGRILSELGFRVVSDEPGMMSDPDSGGFYSLCTWRMDIGG